MPKGNMWSSVPLPQFHLFYFVVQCVVIGVAAPKGTMSFWSYCGSFRGLVGSLSSLAKSLTGLSDCLRGKTGSLRGHRQIQKPGWLPQKPGWGGRTYIWDIIPLFYRTLFPSGPLPKKQHWQLILRRYKMKRVQKAQKGKWTQVRAKN